MMRVRDVISSKGSDAVLTIRPDAPVSELLDALADNNIGALVVSEDGRTMVGIVSERDIVRKLRGVESPRDQSVSDIMTADVRTCGLDDSFESLMEVMTEHRIRHVPIVGEEGDLLGVVSIGDAVKFRMSQLQFERDQLNQYVASAQ